MPNKAALQVAEQWVVEVEQRIARQERLIARLEPGGNPTKLREARALLDTLREAQRHAVGSLDELRRAQKGGAG